MSVSGEYNLFLKFIEAYQHEGFSAIDDDSPMMNEMLDMLIKNRQFFFLADMMRWEILYISKNCGDIVDLSLSTLNARTMYSITHPDDIRRHAVSRSKMFKLCAELFNNKDAYVLMSTSFRFRNKPGSYSNQVMQGYVFTDNLSDRTVYCMFINTDIEWYRPITHGFHYYVGNDLSYFRLPDKELINIGCLFTKREFEIIKLVREGLDSKKIGDQLFLSVHTVDTHRRNILKKTGKPSINVLIIDLQESGVF